MRLLEAALRSLIALENDTPYTCFALAEQAA